MKWGELFLLLSDKKSFLARADKDLQTHDGVIKLKDLLRKNFGEKIKTHLGREYRLAKPTLADIIQKKIARTAQVILPKDAAMILAYTGLRQDSSVVDAGTGSGYLAIF